MKRLVIWLPLGLFLAFAIIVGLGLSNPADRTIRSRLIGKPVPVLSLPAALPGRQGVTTAAGRSGEPRLLNVFASWCLPCVAEAPQLLALERRGVPIDAIAVRDKPEDIARFLSDHGDPYRAIGADPNSRAQFALGSSGVPETFVIDAKGVIRYQHIGDIRPEDVGEILAAYEAAK